MNKTREAKYAIARFVSKHNFALRSTGLAVAVVIAVVVPLVAILSAPAREPQESAAVMRIVAAAFALIPMYFTAITAYHHTSVRNRISLIFVSGVLTSVGAALFTNGMPHDVAVAMVTTALIGAAAGYLVGILVPNAAFRGSLDRRFRRLVHKSF